MLRDGIILPSGGQYNAIQRKKSVGYLQQNLYYVDKTMFIPELEKQPRNLFFIRPRRFGKSLFLSMLHSYYDCNQSAKFQSLFGKLWIGQHPMELQGKYQVLFLDFSQVSGNIDSLERNFDFYCSVKLDGFMRRYGESYSEETREKVRKAEYAMDKLAFIHESECLIAIWCFTIFAII